MTQKKNYIVFLQERRRDKFYDIDPSLPDDDYFKELGKILQNYLLTCFTSTKVLAYEFAR